MAVLWWLPLARPGPPGLTGSSAHPSTAQAALSVRAEQKQRRADHITTERWWWWYSRCFAKQTHTEPIFLSCTVRCSLYSSTLSRSCSWVPNRPCCSLPQPTETDRPVPFRSVWGLLAGRKKIRKILQRHWRKTSRTRSSGGFSVSVHFLSTQARVILTTELTPNICKKYGEFERRKT